jgi:hypothetical protein
MYGKRLFFEDLEVRDDAYLLALNKLFWITPGISRESDEALLMEEFAANLKDFVYSWTLYHEMEPKLLETPLHLLTKVEQIALLKELRITDLHFWLRMEREGPHQTYPDIKINQYSRTFSTTSAEDVFVSQEEMWV